MEKKRQNYNKGGPSKKFRAESDDEDDFGGTFDENLAEMEEMEYENIIESDMQETLEMGPDTQQTSSKWSRPFPPTLNPSKDKLTFQQLDIDNYIGDPLAGMPGSQIGPVPIMRMFGVTMDGNSVCCHVHGFSPYFYVSAPDRFRESHCKPFKDALNNAVIADLRGNKDKIQEAVLMVEMVQKINLYGYTGNEKSLFLKITVALPRLIAAAKRLLEKENVYPTFSEHCYKMYESNVDFDIRFMVDCHITGCCWIELPAGVWKLRGNHPHTNLNYPLLSRCQFEVDVSYEKLVAHPPEGEWGKVAPFRILSFDIECAGRKGIFPEPNEDPVIQIANMVIKQGDTEPFIKNVFTLDTCAPIADSQVISCAKETDLLEKWAEFVREVDPDIFTGYNINNFDFPYLIDRSKHINAKNFTFLGRIRNSRSQIKLQVIQSNQMGRRENKHVNFEGRVPFDLFFVLLRDYKLRSYSLNAVSYHFLQEQKEDVHHSTITDLQNGTPQTRKRLAVYCLKDAYLPLRLLDKLMCLINYMEMSRVTGVCLDSLLTRGQQIKVVSQLLRKAREKDYIMPAHYGGIQDEQFEGATVIEPKKGYYADPIATLDFNSLYPSIMMAHNLCYTTLMKDNVKLPQDQFSVTPANYKFVKSSVRKGLLPEILESLLTARKKAKTDLKNETDPFKKKVLDGRQLALKISANSVYGFTGAQVGKLPCLEISSSVTSYGRQMIELTKTEVEQRYSMSNGYEHDAVVIYGDTDSVMVKFGGQSMERAMELGREAAEYVSKKIYQPN
uniref:DNA polymerase n=1 Tax=Clastoptera arizonana TaxID=38151 RepID=A0A1B6CWL1_9HEMI